MLGIQTNLINLYSNNLSAVATQAALIGGFSFTAVSVTYEASGPTQLALGYVYYVFFTICLVSSLFILSQATIVVMFGPTMALKGASDEAVKFAAGHMMQQQLIILRAASVAITSLFLAACVLSWAYYPVGIATITTVVYMVAYYFLVKLGYEAYRTFVPKDDSAFLEPLLEMAGLYQNSNKNSTSRSLSLSLSLALYLCCLLCDAHVDDCCVVGLCL